MREPRVGTSRTRWPLPVGEGATAKCRHKARSKPREREDSPSEANAASIGMSSGLAGAAEGPKLYSAKRGCPLEVPTSKGSGGGRRSEDRPGSVSQRALGTQRWHLEGGREACPHHHHREVRVRVRDWAARAPPSGRGALWGGALRAPQGSAERGVRLPGSRGLRDWPASAPPRPLSLRDTPVSEHWGSHSSHAVQCHHTLQGHVAEHTKRKSPRSRTVV